MIQTENTTLDKQTIFLDLVRGLMLEITSQQDDCAKLEKNKEPT